MSNLSRPCERVLLERTLLPIHGFSIWCMGLNPCKKRHEPSRPQAFEQQHVVKCRHKDHKKKPNLPVKYKINNKQTPRKIRKCKLFHTHATMWPHSSSVIFFQGTGWICWRRRRHVAVIHCCHRPFCHSSQSTSCTHVL